jgi:MoaA/NifB/PqqE/SkfB family radical SAM enzyme
MEGYQTIDEIRSIKPSQLILTGGDVFERNDLDKLVDYARRCDLEPSVEVSATSNLTQLSVQRLARAGARRLVIGLDGHQPEDHETTRGSHDTFGVTVDAARWAHQASLHVEVNTLASPATLAHFPQLAALLEEMAIQRWNIWFPVPIASAKGIATLSPFEREDLFALIHEARIERDFAIRVFEAPAFDRFKSQHGQTNRASVAGDVVFISATGSVTPDPFSEVIAGNLRNQPLRIIVQNNAVFGTRQAQTQRVT